MGYIFLCLCYQKENISTTNLHDFYDTLLILRGKNLLWNNSSWDFEGIVDTMDPYLFFPDGNFSPHTYLTNIFGTRKMGAGVDKIFIFPKRSIREKFHLQNLGVAEVFFCLKVLSTFYFDHFFEQLLQTIAAPSG